MALPIAGSLGVSTLHSLVGEDFLELPYSVPGLVLFDVVDDVIVGDNRLAFIVDKASEFRNRSGIVRIISHAVLVGMDSFNNLRT